VGSRLRYEAALLAQESVAAGSAENGRCAVKLPSRVMQLQHRLFACMLGVSVSAPQSLQSPACTALPCL
jgi:hypothetical protein